MPYLIPTVLLALWLAGFLTGVGGNLVHVLAVAAAVAFLIPLWKRRHHRDSVNCEFKRIV